MSTLWIKICGLRDREGIDAALAAGANALGFVFAESVRRIDPADAAGLVADLRGEADIVAVMRHPTQAHCKRVCDVLKPDYLQTDAADLAELSVPENVKTLPVYRDSDALPDAASQSHAGAGRQRFHGGPCLYEGAKSGQGELADWARACKLARLRSVVLAGGLAADNVAAAIKSVEPWGVDVSSGVEVSRGIKSPQLIREFIDTARSAGAAGSN